MSRAPSLQRLRHVYMSSGTNLVQRSSFGRVFAVPSATNDAMDSNPGLLAESPASYALSHGCSYTKTDI